MQLIKWQPFNELDHLFEDRVVPMFPRVGLDLAADVYEEDGKIVAKMNLPGVKDEELDISVEEDSLTISGKREEEKETTEKDYYSKEIRRGSFSRTLALPKLVDTGKAEATYEGGTLTVTMPALAESKPSAVKVTIKK